MNQNYPSSFDIDIESVSSGLSLSSSNSCFGLFSGMGCFTIGRRVLESAFQWKIEGTDPGFNVVLTGVHLISLGLKWREQTTVCSLIYKYYEMIV